MTAPPAFAGLDIPGPTVTATSAPFWAAARDGRLDLQHCAGCERWVFYPREICPHCWSGVLRWRTAGGRGRLLTWSVIHRPGHPGFAPAAPYAVGLVRLDEGPTMLSAVLGPVGALALDAPLRVRFETAGGAVLPLFELDR